MVGGPFDGTIGIADRDLPPQQCDGAQRTVSVRWVGWTLSVQDRDLEVERNRMTELHKQIVANMNVAVTFASPTKTMDF